eukprot:425013-Prymnesium_polylepis.1
MWHTPDSGAIPPLLWWRPILCVADVWVPDLGLALRARPGVTWRSGAGAPWSDTATVDVIQCQKKTRELRRIAIAPRRRCRRVTCPRLSAATCVCGMQAARGGGGGVVGGPARAME